jgi:GT2 family glycosyltransferase
VPEHLSAQCRQVFLPAEISAAFVWLWHQVSRLSLSQSAHATRIYDKSMHRVSAKAAEVKMRMDHEQGNGGYTSPECDQNLVFSVIIPVYRDWKRLAICLEALSRQSLSPDEFEVIIVDNEPGHGFTVPPLPRNAKIIIAGEPGSYNARNAAVALARGCYLAFTDSDCIPDPNWLANALAALQEQPSARHVGPIPIFREQTGRYYAYLYEFHTAFRQKEIAMEGISTTANLAVSRAAFDKVGLFDTNLLSGGDYVWSRRAEKAGIPLVFHDNIIVRHPARASLKAILAKKRRTSGGEAMFKRTSVWTYNRYRLVPRVSAINFDRGSISMIDKTVLLGIAWLRNIHGCFAFTTVRLGLKKPNRS